MIVPRGGFLYTMIVLGGGFLLPSSRVPGVCPGVGMVLDEIDTCIMQYCETKTSSNFRNVEFQIMDSPCKKSRYLQVN